MQEGNWGRDLQETVGVQAEKAYPCSLLNSSAMSWGGGMAWDAKNVQERTGSSAPVNSPLDLQGSDIHHIFVNAHLEK